jgi:lysozyme
VTIVAKRSPVKRKTTAKRKSSAKKKGNAGLSSKLKIVLAGTLLILLSPLYYGYVLKPFTSAWSWITNIGQDPNYRTYSSFNIPVPTRYKFHGIDVSSYQGKINWGKVKEMQEDDVKIKFAFIKATEGLLHLDPYFQRNWREAAKAGIICGAYHYFRPKKSGKWQAKFFLQTVQPEKGDLPMVVDIEELDGISAVKMREELHAFLKHIENKTKAKPIIYTGISFYQDYLQGYFDDYNLWIAHYYKPELKVSKKTSWRFWQHSDMATIDGINHVVDMNVFNGDSLDFQSLLIR